MGEALTTIKTWFTERSQELLVHDIRWEVRGYPVPRSVYHGRKSVYEDFFPSLLAQFKAWKLNPGQMLEATDGEHVTVLGFYDAVKLDGMALKIPFLHVWSVRNAEIASVVAAVDARQFASA